MRAAVALAACFAALAGLNAAGAFHRPDDWAVHHVMPGLDPAAVYEPSLVEALRPLEDRAHGWQIPADVWLYPASAPLAALLVGAAAVALARRGRTRAAILWPAALVAGVAVEVLVKHVVRRPALAEDGRHIAAFDGSLPSGHALRALIVAAALAFAWRRLAPPAGIWAATVPPLLVVAGWHTLSDVVAGVALAGACVATVLALLRPS